MISKQVQLGLHRSRSSCPCPWHNTMIPQWVRDNDNYINKTAYQLSEMKDPVTRGIEQVQGHITSTVWEL